MLIYDTLFVRVWSGGGMVHTESVMASFLFWLSFPLLPVHTNHWSGAKRLPYRVTLDGNPRVDNRPLKCAWVPNSARH